MSVASERVKAWRKANPEDARRLRRRWAAGWRERNPEKHRERVATSRSRNRESYNARQRIHNQARRARERGQFVEFVDPVKVLEQHDGLCGICGEPVGDDFHVDHIVPLARGGEHSYANTQPAHPVCNAKKGMAL